MAKLKCHVTGGILAHEIGILIDGVGQQYESIVDDKMISRNRGVNGAEINVAVVATDDNRETYLVELPRQVTMGGRRIWVPKTNVKMTD